MYTSENRYQVIITFKVKTDEDSSTSNSISKAIILNLTKIVIFTCSFLPLLLEMENRKQTTTLASCPLAGVVGGKSSA